MAADRKLNRTTHARARLRRALRGGTVAALLFAIAPAWADGGAAPIAATKRGERLFLQCRACHSTGTETAGKIGPPLENLFGRKAGTYAGFKYSTALAGSGLTWDEATLDRWLTSPATLVPGTAMVYIGLPKAEDRRALVEYLRRATTPAQ